MLKGKASGAVNLDIPDEREYDAAADAEVDEALVTAIDKAEAADNEYLTNLLRHELGSFYLRQHASE